MVQQRINNYRIRHRIRHSLKFFGLEMTTPLSQTPNESKEYLIDGFVRHIQSLLPYSDDPYYIIQNDLINICKSYIYWYKLDLTNHETIQKKNIYIDPIIIKQANVLLFEDQDFTPWTRQMIHIMINRFSYVYCNIFLP